MAIPWLKCPIHPRCPWTASAVKDSAANYPWAYVVDANGTIAFSDVPPAASASRQIVCGYFNFSDPALLREACDRRSITDALNHYTRNRALTPYEVEQWHDFGHLPLYYQSKRDMLVTRTFNATRTDGHVLIKTSSQADKMMAEARWYETLPPSLSVHAPKYLGRIEEPGCVGYALEYLFYPTLGDLHAFGRLPPTSWLGVLDACFDMLDRCHEIRPSLGAPEAETRLCRSFS